MPHATMTAFLVGSGCFAADPFTLFDVGCSGGLQQQWRQFGDSLVAYGFDPMVAECQRLRDKEKNPRVRYVNAFVGLPEDHPQVLARKALRNGDAERTSAALAARLMTEKLSQRQRQVVLNAWGHQELTPEPPISLDDYAARQGLDDIDFIKIDVDGSDIDVVLSAAASYEARAVLGVQVEVSLCGGASPAENTFHNIDRILRGHGFELYDLNTWKYSRAALPSSFLWDAPWQTVTGKINFGDAVYMRDACAPQTVGLLGRLPASKLLKLACCYELYHQQDSAAELLLRHADRIAPLAPVDRLLDLLAASTGLYGKRKYRAIVADFQADPRQFYRTAFLFGAQHEVLFQKMEAWAARHAPGRSCVVFGANDSGLAVAGKAASLGLRVLGFADNLVTRLKRRRVRTARELAALEPDLVIVVSKAHAATIVGQLRDLHPRAGFDIISTAKG